MNTPVDPTAPGGVPPGWTLPRIRITRDGEWLHEGEEVTHPGILTNLRENLCVDAEGHYLQIGPVRVPVEVDDAPFVVIRLAPDDERLMVTLSDLTREALAAETLTFDAAGVPHCRVKAGRFAAHFNRAATYQLLDRVEHEEGQPRAALLIGPRRVSIPAPPAAD